MMNQPTAGQRIAVERAFFFPGADNSPRYGVVLKVISPASIDVLYDGATNKSNIDPRIARELKEGER